MKARPTAGIDERRREERKRAQRMPRRQAQGPIGFSQVMSLVRPGSRQGGGNGGGAGGQQSQQQPEAQSPAAATAQAGAPQVAAPAAAAIAPTPAPAQAQPAPAPAGGGGIDAALLTGSGMPAEQATATVLGHGLMLDPGALAVSRPNEPTPLMTPQFALEMVANEAGRMQAEHEVRELKIQLEPEHLGPLLVKITVERGRIRAELATRTVEAAHALAAGQEQLRQKLARLGYSEARVEIRQAADDDFIEPVER